MRRIDRRETKWSFFRFALGAALVVGPVVGLYIGARQGDVVSIVILGCLVALVLLFLGALGVLFVLHQRNQWEQTRFQMNARENLDLLQQSQRLLSQQALGQARTSRAIGAQLGNVDRLLGAPEPERLTMDIGNIAWDVDVDALVDDDRWQQ